MDRETLDARQFTFTEDGQSQSFWNVGPLHMKPDGDFGGGTLKLQVRDPNDSKWMDVVGMSVTDATKESIADYPEKARQLFRFDLGGSTNPALDVIVT